MRYPKEIGLNPFSFTYITTFNLCKRPLIFSYSFLLGDGVVTLCDIGAPKLPTYDGANPQKLMRLFPDYGDVLNIVWSGDNRWLLAGTAAGLVGWNIEDEKVKKEGEKYK